MILPLWNRQKREARRAFLAAHRESLAEAQVVYDEFKDRQVVIQEGTVPGFDFISAASPTREAYDVYWQSMVDRGFAETVEFDLFERELRT